MWYEECCVIKSDNISTLAPWYKKRKDEFYCEKMSFIVEGLFGFTASPTTKLYPLIVHRSLRMSLRMRKVCRMSVIRFALGIFNGETSRGVNPNPNGEVSRVTLTLTLTLTRELRGLTREALPRPEAI